MRSRLKGTWTYTHMYQISKYFPRAESVASASAVSATTTCLAARTTSAASSSHASSRSALQAPKCARYWPHAANCYWLVCGTLSCLRLQFSNVSHVNLLCAQAPRYLHGWQWWIWARIFVRRQLTARDERLYLEQELRARRGLRTAASPATSMTRAIRTPKSSKKKCHLLGCNLCLIFL